MSRQRERRTVNQGRMKTKGKRETEVAAGVRRQSNGVPLKYTSFGLTLRGSDGKKCAMLIVCKSKPSKADLRLPWSKGG